MEHGRLRDLVRPLRVDPAREDAPPAGLAPVAPGPGVVVAGGLRFLARGLPSQHIEQVATRKYAHTTGYTCGYRIHSWTSSLCWVESF